MGSIRRSCRFVTAFHILLAAAFAGATLYRMFSAHGVIDSDFTVFRSAWWLILHGHGASLYDASAQAAAQHYLMGGRQFAGGLMAFLNPPHAALAGVPLGWLAEHLGGGAAFALWAIVNVLLLVRLDGLVRARLQADRGELRWAVTFAILAFYPVLYTIAIGQLSLLLAVAVLELLRAVEADRARAAAGWLLVLTIKPQLVPGLVLLLAARGHWRILAAAAGGAGAIGLATMMALGRTIWLGYLQNLHSLERYFAAGTPAHMMNFRGALTRLAPGESADVVYAASLAGWIAAMAVLAAILLRRRTTDPIDFSSDFALTLALSLFFNPHVFPQDTVIWIAALVCFVEAHRERGRAWRPFAAFALSWPLVFAAARALDGPAGSAAYVSPVPVVLGVAVAVMIGERLTRPAGAVAAVRSRAPSLAATSRS
jgi:hypothetical protein